jgi:glycosyltransferase involved in cell wall biosynthesis
MKVSFIATVFNEEKSISTFLESIFNQSLRPDEIIIVDAGSTDKTLFQISDFRSKISDKKKIDIKVFIKKGTRSVGRNEAVKHATGDIIAISDAGNILDRRWVENIIKPFKDGSVDVVAGYYKGLAKSIFEKCLIPYVLVMPDKANAAGEFLPSTRSMAIRKSAFIKSGGFNPKLNYGEDYEFANRLKDKGFKFAFVKDAIVGWMPRKNIFESFKMFFKLAMGDAQARILRDKVVYLFLRYIFAVYLLALGLVMRSVSLWEVYGLLILMYICWSIKKNYKYVKQWQAIYYLPLLQVTSDIAVISGSLVGALNLISLKSVINTFIKNKGLLAIILSYVFIELSVINWGIPNINTLFTYHMDEWHQSQSVRDMFKYGTPNMAGAANGTIFQFFLTGIYLIPFYILKIVNPFAIKSSVLNLELQQRLFEVLRLNTLLFGVFSIILIYFIAKRYFKTNGFVTTLFFVVNPLWLMLSNYFKYDIALIFWIIISLFFILEYINKHKTLNFVLACMFSALAFSVKVSAIPLLPALILIFIIFTPNFTQRLKTFCIGLLVYFSTVVFFGIPDLIFGKGSLVLYLTSNIIDTPKALTNNLNLGMNYWEYFLTRISPLLFGKALYFVYFLSLIFIILFVLWAIKKHKLHEAFNNYKNYLSLFICLLLFMYSLYPLGASATGNRILVLLPFLTLISGGLLSKLLSNKSMIIKFSVYAVVIIILLFQFFDSYKLFKYKFYEDSRTISSEWILKNLNPDTKIGIENIPIYQSLPNIILKDFYLQQYGINNKLFTYKVVGPKDNLPDVVIVTNAEIEASVVKFSVKNDLIKKLNNNHYQVIQIFKASDDKFLSLRNRFDLLFSGLVPIVDTISVYRHDKSSQLP